MSRRYETFGCAALFPCIIEAAEDLLKHILSFDAVTRFCTFAQSLQRGLALNWGCNMASPNPRDPKYAPGAEQSRQDVMVGVTVAMTILGGSYRMSPHISDQLLMIAVTCVALRIYTRGFLVRKLNIADWIMVTAAVSKSHSIRDCT